MFYVLEILDEPTAPTAPTVPTVPHVFWWGTMGRTLRPKQVSVKRAHRLRRIARAKFAQEYAKRVKLRAR